MILICLAFLVGTIIFCLHRGFSQVNILYLPAVPHAWLTSLSVVFHTDIDNISKIQSMKPMYLTKRRGDNHQTQTTIYEFEKKQNNKTLTTDR